MKYLGYVKLDQLQERQKFQEFFRPLTKSEYADLRENIREAGILNPLIIKRNGDHGFVILSGHHRKKIAEEIGLEEVPCSLAETTKEMVQALMENAIRRQMKETERKKQLARKRELQDCLCEDGLIPEVYALYKEDKIDKALLDDFLDMGVEHQRRILRDCSIERIVVPQDVQDELERRAEEIEEQKNHHALEIGRLEEKLALAETDKTKAEEQLKEQKKTLEEIKEKVKAVFEKYDRTKEEVAVEVRREYEEQLADAEKEREKREAVVKEKDRDIGELKEQIDSWKARKEGVEAAIGLWRHEIARTAQQYNDAVDHYSSPTIMQCELRFCLERVQSLIEWSKEQVWDPRALPILEQHDKAIRESLQVLIGTVKGHPKPFVSLKQADKIVADGMALIEKAAGQGPKEESLHEEQT
jgi:ParB-like chromosome segregation protein Spo0J